jgi:hypothetical protein
VVCLSDNEALIMRRPWPISGSCAMGGGGLIEEGADLSRYFVNFSIFSRCQVQNTN